MDEKEKTEQLAKISYQLLQINENLERILNAQFGIDDPEWINAINKLEEGFGLAFSWVAKTKGASVPKIYDNKDVERVLSEQKLREIISSEELKNRTCIMSSDKEERPVAKSSEIKSTVKLSDMLVKLSGKEENEKIIANTKERYERILTSKDEYEKMLADKHEKEQIYWSKYVPAIRPYIYWLKDLIESSKNGIVHINLSDFAKECGFKMKDLANDDDNNDNIGENLEEINPHELYNGFKFALKQEDIFVDIKPSKIDGQLVLNFENKNEHIMNKYDDEFVIVNLKVPKAFEGQKYFSRETCIIDYIQTYYKDSDDGNWENSSEISEGMIMNGIEIAYNKKEILGLLEDFKNDKSWLEEAEDRENDNDEGDLDFVDLFNIMEDNIECE